MIYGWKLDSHMETSLVTTSLNKAIKHIKKLTKKLPTNIIWHQDQGSQYTSYIYVNKILSLGSLSYSTKGTPTENAGQESFHGRLKNEYQDQFLECATLQELHRLMKYVLKDYNNKRIHTSIGNMAPKKFTKKFLKSR